MRHNSLKDPKVYIAFIVVLFLVVFLFPNNGEFKYKYQRGKPWLYETLISPIDFPVLKTDEELQIEREEIGSKVVPYYYYDYEVQYLQTEEFDRARSSIAVSDDFALALLNEVSNIYQVGLLSSYDYEGGSKKIIFIQRDKRSKEIPQSEVYDVKRANYKVRSSLEKDFPNLNVDSLLNILDVNKYLVPNLIYDDENTELLHRESVDFISPVKSMFYTGQLIVSNGEIVTAEIAQILDSYKTEYLSSFVANNSHVQVLFGFGIYMAVIISILFVVIYFLDNTVYTNKNIYYFLLLLFMLIYLLTVYVGDYNQKLLYLVPYAVFPLYMVSFFKQSSAFSVYAIMLLPITLLAVNGLELYTINLFAGMIVVYSFKYLSRGWLQFINSLITFLGLFICYLAYRLLSDDIMTGINLEIVMYLGVNAILITAAYPLVFLFEKMFSLVTKSRLRDLADTNTPLLQELSKKAPGTFQHSLQVANLAADAAREIKADSFLVKVGALYHDVGKIYNPQCFIEDQPATLNYHAGLTPFESAQQIIRHVDDGLEIAKKHKIPPIILDFINTHHAQSLVAYFYTSYCNNGGDPENIEPFKYHGELPVTKEQVILMLADSVEAASRSLKDYSKESVTKLVESIIVSRMTDYQLSKADISLKELTIVKERFIEFIQQIYHSRIAYPTRK